MKAPLFKGLKSFANIYAIHADTIAELWSGPVDVGIGGYIDPGRVVDADDIGD